MNFKYYDIISTLISGVVLLFISSIIFCWDISDINVVILLSLAYIMGYILNALSALFEPIYYWFMGGMPSDKLLRSPKPKRCGKVRNYTGFGRVRFYEYDKVVKLLRDDIGDDIADERKMFGRAMSYSNSNEKSRVPDFNAHYAFSRVILTLVLVSSCLVISKYYDLWWVWLISLLIIWLVGRRCKERGYYYAREVLVEYLKAKK